VAALRGEGTRIRIEVRKKIKKKIFAGCSEGKLKEATPLSFVMLAFFSQSFVGNTIHPKRTF
jgi:hypothetical protein